MKRFVIGKTFFLAYERKLLYYLHCNLKDFGTHTTIIDSMKEQLLLDSNEKSLAGTLIEDIYIPAEVTDKDSIIFGCLKDIPNGASINIVYDCSSLDQSYTAQILHRLQYDISAFNNTVESVCIICNDYEIMDYVKIMSSFSRIIPLNLPESDINLRVASAYHHAKYNQYFKNARLKNAVVLLYRIYKKFLKK